MLSPEQQAEIDLQVALSKNLAFGVVLSLLPVAGLGSIAAIWIGVRGWRRIEASGRKLVGTGVATWCVAAGVVGLLANIVFFWPIVFYQ